MHATPWYDERPEPQSKLQGKSHCIMVCTWAKSCKTFENPSQKNEEKPLARIVVWNRWEIHTPDAFKSWRPQRIVCSSCGSDFVSLSLVLWCTNGVEHSALARIGEGIQDVPCCKSIIISENDKVHLLEKFFELGKIICWAFPPTDLTDLAIKNKNLQSINQNRSDFEKAMGKQVEMFIYLHK